MEERALQDVRERLIRIETLLESSSKDYDIRIKKLEDNQTWLYRLFIGGIITGALGMLFAFAK